MHTLVLFDIDGTLIPTNRAGWTPLFHAVNRARDRDSFTHLELLLQLGSDVNYTDRNGRTPLMVAASAGRKKAAMKLLEHYADVDRTDRFGWTALMLAVYYDQTTIVELLLQSGCDVNITTPQGLTALRIAQKHERKKAIGLLLEFGAEMTNEDE